MLGGLSGASLLTFKLNLILSKQAIIIPQAPAPNQPAPAAKPTVVATNRPLPNAPNQAVKPNPRPGGGNQAVVQSISGGPLNPNQLRNAYNKLREERRDDYIKQQQLDVAIKAEQEEQEV